jgi:hypothetical protein
MIELFEMLGRQAGLDHGSVDGFLPSHPSFAAGSHRRSLRTRVQAARRNARQRTVSIGEGATGAVASIPAGG